MNNRPYQICTNCVMDTSDTTLRFDEARLVSVLLQLSHEHPAERASGRARPSPKSRLLSTRSRKRAGDAEHDCIIGISGGLDSSYVTYIAKEKFGLRPLMFHCDTGWNSDLGVSNIQKMIDGLGLDLVTEVVNWEEMKDLQRAFFKSQVFRRRHAAGSALFSAMYNFAARNGFK